MSTKKIKPIAKISLYVPYLIYSQNGYSTK